MLVWTKEWRRRPVGVLYEQWLVERLEVTCSQSIPAQKVNACRVCTLHLQSGRRCTDCMHQLHKVCG